MCACLNTNKDLLQNEKSHLSSTAPLPPQRCTYSRAFSSDWRAATVPMALAGLDTADMRGWRCVCVWGWGGLPVLRLKTSEASSSFMIIMRRVTFDHHERFASTKLFNSRAQQQIPLLQRPKKEAAAADRDLFSFFLLLCSRRAQQQQQSTLAQRRADRK